MTFAVTNIKQNTDGSVGDLKVLQTLPLGGAKFGLTQKSSKKVWDLFNDFNSPKNASNVIRTLLKIKNQ